jgi:hypothetical protein
LFATIGARRNSAGGVNVFKLVADSDICHFIFNAKHGAAESQPKERGQQSGTGVSPVCFYNRRQLCWNTQARRLCHYLAGKFFAERDDIGR